MPLVELENACLAMGEMRKVAMSKAVGDVDT